MTAQTYTIDRVADLLQVSFERRADCLRNIEYALEFHVFVHGEGAPDAEFGPVVWTDDGDSSVTVAMPDGDDLLLKVTNHE